MDIQIPLTIKFFKDLKSKTAPWVAYTPELDVSSCGPTRQKAKKNLEETIQIVLKGAVEDGNLKDLLLEAGFEIKKSEVKPPTISLDKFTFHLDSNLAHNIWAA